LLAPHAAAIPSLHGAQLLIPNALRGLRDTRSPLWIAAACYWVIGRFAGFWLCVPMGKGATGLWLCLIGGALAAIVMMSLRYRTRMSQAEARLAFTAAPAGR
jgi:MATE family multidrug resistance protein